MEVQAPTIGRVIHFFPNYRPDTKHIIKGHLPDVCAAIVNTESITPTLTVFTGKHHEPMEVYANVPHESAKEEYLPYWDWPPLKK